MRIRTIACASTILLAAGCGGGDPGDGSGGSSAGPGSGGGDAATTGSATVATTAGPGTTSGTGGDGSGGSGAGDPGNVGIARRIAYHELTKGAAEQPGGGYPVMSRDGSRIAYPIAPGVGAPPNRIFVVDAEGGAPREVDSYVPLCGCGAKIAISDDGGTVVSSDGAQLRVVSAEGGLRSELVLTSGEIWSIDVSGDGQRVFFEMARDSANFDTGAPIQRGVYEMDADTGAYTQIISPQQVAATFGEANPDNVFTFAGCGNSLAVSSDGETVVAATNLIGRGQAVVGRGGSEVLPPNTQGFGLVQSIGISGDGSTVAVWRDAEGGFTELGVVGADGSGHKILEAQGGQPGCFAPVSVTDDGSKVVLGYGPVVYTTDESEPPWNPVLHTGAYATPQWKLAEPSGNSQDGRISGDGKRIMFLSNDGVTGRQIALAEIDVAELGTTPSVSGPVFDPTTIPNDLTVSSHIAVQASGGDAAVMVVGTIGFQTAAADPNLLYGGALDLNDTGITGDVTAGDGLFSATGIAASTTAEPGPRWIRIKAEAIDAGGRRSAFAIDAGPLTVD